MAISRLLAGSGVLAVRSLPPAELAGHRSARAPRSPGRVGRRMGVRALRCRARGRITVLHLSPETPVVLGVAEHELNGDPFTTHRALLNQTYERLGRGARDAPGPVLLAPVDVLAHAAERDVVADMADAGMELPERYAMFVDMARGSRPERRVNMALNRLLDLSSIDDLRQALTDVPELAGHASAGASRWTLPRPATTTTSSDWWRGPASSSLSCGRRSGRRGMAALLGRTRPAGDGAPGAAHPRADAAVARRGRWQRVAGDRGWRGAARAVVRRSPVQGPRPFAPRARMAPSGPKSETTASAARSWTEAGWPG
jgi:hypothetical protein